MNYTMIMNLRNLVEVNQKCASWCVFAIAHPAPSRLQHSSQSLNTNPSPDHHPQHHLRNSHLAEQSHHASQHTYSSSPVSALEFTRPVFCSPVRVLEDTMSDGGLENVMRDAVLQLVMRSRAIVRRGLVGKGRGVRFRVTREEGSV